MLKLLIVSALIFFIFPSTVNAQIVINEFSSNSDTEWVELYNLGLNSVDMTGWKIKDEAQSPKIITGTIPAEGYFVFENASGWLNNSGSDTITLLDSTDVVIDIVQYGTGGVVGIPSSDKSSGRVPNGNSNWQSNLSWSKGSVNPEPTPSPSPTPTLSPTNSPTPTSQPTATPTKTPSPAPTKTATPKPSSTPTTEPSETPFVLGENIETQTQKPTPTALVKSKSEGKFPIIPVALISSGLLMLGFGVLQLVNARKNSQES